MEFNFCPAWLLRRLQVPERLHAHVGVLLSSLLALTISPLLIHVPHFCLAQRLFGVPCPGCGIMHSLIALLHLRIADAWRSNPAGVFLGLYLSCQICGRGLALISEITSSVVPRLSRIGEGVVMVSLVGVWAARLLKI